MKKKLKFIIAILLVAGIGGVYGFYVKKTDKDRVLIELVQYVLKEGHYSPKNLDDDFSKTFYTDYLKSLDYSKRYLLKSDVEEFTSFKTLIDDQLRIGDLTFFDLTYQKIRERTKESKKIYTDILSKPFDFKRKDVITFDVDKIEYVKNHEELLDRWRIYLKYNVLNRLTDAIESQNKEIEQDSIYQEKSFEQMEIDAREGVLKTFNDWNKRLLELDRDDWFSVYLNVLTAQFDPHTTYFAPKDKERFDQDISGQLEGIGAVLQVKDDYVTVSQIISGSPSWKQGDLEVEDKILKVAQGSKEPVSIVGMRLSDAVKLIKGKKGTKVRLFVKKIDGSKKEIPIIRDIVEIEETFAKSAVIENDKEKYGLINLPKFYINFEDKNARNAAEDVEKEIERLKKENVEGIILDLRNNGGGSLQTAVQMVGLFIKKGPVVQVKARNSSPKILKDRDPKIQWDKPLVILVNEYSASASEILAAALKDYGRAVIVGSNHTYGKGTVQNIWNLDNLINSKIDVKSLGALKLTIQKFYRINGGATQLKGVMSDIVLPNKYVYLKIGEKEQENPMKWDTITALKYEKWHLKHDIDYVKSNSDKRIKDSDYFKLIDANAKWLKSRRDNKKIALDLETFTKDNEKFEEDVKKFKPLTKYDNKLLFLSTGYELGEIKKDTVLAKKREVWHKNLVKDAYIEESVNILRDLK